MSNQKSESQNHLLDAVEQKDVVEFLNERAKNHNCPVCLSNKWTLIMESDMAAGVPMFRKDGGLAVPPPNIPAVAAGCDVCGFLRLHALGVIAQWKKKKTNA
ncbi:hypothetical protein [Burkholderia semiarida]|uniref:hypothetical protein n=1 Tax=Burkholderia semiarida TaxID=2843303 RepID=UPI003877A473